MTATYSQVKSKLTAAGYAVTKVGSKIKAVKGEEEKVFSSPSEALKWVKEKSNDKEKSMEVGSEEIAITALSIKEAANKTIFELIAPSDRLEIEQKGYQLEELAKLAEIEDGGDKTTVFKALALKGLAFFYQTDAWYPLPLR